MTSDSQHGSSELSVLQGQVTDIAIHRAPEVVLAEARNAAVALQDVIKNKTDPVIMNGQQYLEYEDWQTVGRFYHVTAKVEKTEYVQYGAVRGFSASAVALRSDGAVISRAEADCLNDEPKWASKPKYEWRDKEGGGREKVHIGDEPVPLFQLKSMAQTRACAKALRNVLAWVVVLAGYRPTPAEELEREHGGEKAAGSGRSEGAQGGGSSSGSSGPATSGGTSAPASGLPEGATKVKDVKTKTGTNARGDWTRWDVTFEDGRRGGTFSKTDGEHAERAEKSGAYVIPKLTKTDKGHDLKGFEKWPEKPKPEEKPHPEEPISGPEQVLTVRKINTDAGPRFVIQTDKRELVSDNSNHADMAVEARKQKVGLTPKVEVVTRPEDGKKFNKLIGLTPEKPIEGFAADAGEPAGQQQEPPAGAQEPPQGKAAKEEKKPRGGSRKPKEREPGEEG